MIERLLLNPLAWALPLSAVGLFLMLPRGSARSRLAGQALGIISLGFYAAAFPLPGGVAERVVFWAMGAIAVGGAAASVSMRSAVYAAVWFAVSLLGVSGLFLFQGAQFLGVVTIVVYAGAIVVTFLFVVMLAQPDGHSVYDRLTWARSSKLFAVLTSALFVGLLSFLLWTEHAAGRGPSAETPTAPVSRTDASALPSSHDILAERHMAHLGRDLFSRYLIGVELAGTVLLAALVGAFAMVMQAHPPRGGASGGDTL